MSGAASITIRVEPELQASFMAACKAADVSASQVLRAAMRDFLASNAQANLPLSSSKRSKSQGV